MSVATTELSRSTQHLIDSRLDTIDRMLLGRVSRQERLEIVREVEAQIFEQLHERGAEELSREDVLAVLGRLDPPEAYLPEEAGEAGPVPRADLVEALRIGRIQPVRKGDPRVAKVSGILGLVAMALILLGCPIVLGLVIMTNSVAIFYILGGGILALSFIGSILAISPGGLLSPGECLGDRRARQRDPGDPRQPRRNGPHPARGSLSRETRSPAMPLEAIGPMMRRAVEGRYAVGYFESWNLESLQGVIDAAEETRSPIIIGFNGDFLSRPTRLAAERLAWYAALGRAAAESASVPCGLIFNECPRDDWVRAAIEAGFNLVMLADPEAPADDLTRRVAELARLAHARGVAIEAELGELPCGASGGAPEGGSATDPDAAAAFVAATGVDLLAVSVGNVHIMTTRPGGPGPGPARRDPPAGRDPARPARRHRDRRRCPARGDRAGRGQGQLRHLPQAAVSRRRCDRRSASTAPTRTACWASAGRKISSSPAAGRSATPCSNGSISSAAAERPYNLGPSVSCACCNSATAEGSLMDVVMRMPDVATVDDTVTLVRWLVEVGQTVRRGDPLLEVETDKAILVVESPISGTLNAVSVEPGAEVATGQAIATFGVEEGASAGSTSAWQARHGPRSPTTRADRSRARRGSSRGPQELAAGTATVRDEPAIGGRRSFFARNREAQAQAATAGSSRESTHHPTTARS